MQIAVKLNPADRIRRAKEADPTLTDEQLRDKLGVTISQVKAALAYKSRLTPERKRA